ncbi:hypothetical protein LRL17_28615 [Rhodococcus qingshengii]|uniref:hypothetical protein n=1 Tax=Rhodococcus qingshengii TaxID=334542 RepID=UPI001E5AFA46|nr:hypothetical protein [Rhodococcus qingshengii]UGQ51918.1 hypothetical protein LRL17_28615 [Rhodococcus qingshengii]
MGFPPRAELPLHYRRRIGTGQRGHGGHPAPVGTGVWPEVPSGQTGVSVSAPASQDTIEAAGIFAVSAIETWGVTPWDINLTFGKLVDFA